jgi:hypothetical protein
MDNTHWSPEALAVYGVGGTLLILSAVAWFIEWRRDRKWNRHCNRRLK